MEPVTHILTGACLAKSGFHRRTRYATLAMAVAAEFPDIDTLWGFRGPVASFQHHRGFTHTLLGVPVEATLLLGGFWCCYRWREKLVVPGEAGHRKKLPVRWNFLYGCILLALLSHILLDYTNNYGVRPFFPFNAHWYAASIVFIFDPLLFALLVLGLCLPSLFSLIGQEVSSNQRQVPSPAWPRAALVTVLLLWGVRAYEHQQAVRLASQQVLKAPAASSNEDAVSSGLGGQATGATVELAPESVRPSLSSQRVLASPDPLSVFRWYTATDFGPAYQLGTADTLTGALDPGRVLVKPRSSLSLASAEQSYLGRVYLDWSAMPFLSVSDTGGGGPLLGRPTTTTVLFEDVRFMGDTDFLHRGATPPLTGFVVLDADGRVLEEGMDGRPER